MLESNFRVEIKNMASKAKVVLRFPACIRSLKFLSDTRTFISLESVSEVLVVSTLNSAQARRRTWKPGWKKMYAIAI
jgi:hypothetical protein